MRIKYFCFLIIWLFSLSELPVKADTFSKFQTTEYFSKNRNYVIKVTPDKKAVLKNKNKIIWKKSLSELPETLLITDDGKRTIMIENYYGNNGDRKKEVLIFFDEKGNKLSSFVLEDLADFENILHTTSGSHWLGKYEFNEDNSELIVESVALTCPLPNGIKSEEDRKKIDECRKFKQNENFVFTIATGTLLSRTKIEITKK